MMDYVFNVTLCIAVLSDRIQENTRDWVNLVQHCLFGDATRHGDWSMYDSMPVIFPMNTQAIARLAVSVANRTLVKSPEMMHLKVLLHVSHMYRHFAAEQALDALCAPCVLLSVLRHKLVEFKLFLVRLHVCSPMIVGCAGKASEFYRDSLEFRQVVNFPHMKV